MIDSSSQGANAGAFQPAAAAARLRSSPARRKAGRARAPRLTRLGGYRRRRSSARRRSESLNDDLGQQHVAGRPDRRAALGARHRERGAPGAVDDELRGIVGQRLHALAHRASCRRRSAPSTFAAAVICARRSLRNVRPAAHRAAHRRSPGSRGARAICSTIRNGVGAMPVAMPECTPSVSTRTRSVPVRFPRSEVVHHT